MEIDIMLNINKKLISALALVVAVVMVVSPLAFMGGSDNADAPALGEASTVNGTYTIFVDDGSGWQSQVVNAYDGAQALKTSKFWKSGDNMVAHDTGGAYPSINNTYGDVTTFDGKTENSNNIWNVYVYINGGWVLGNDAVGFYKCFSDYSASWQTANIALQYGADATTVPESLTTYITDNFLDLSAITNVTNTSDFAVTFHLKYAYNSSVTPVINGNIYDINNNLVTVSALSSQNGVTVVGYGSDAYLAFKNALNVASDANVVGEETIPGAGYNNYSWISAIFGLGTIQTAGQDTPSDWTDDKYAYWSQYDGTSTDLSKFVLGSYSPISSALYSQAVFSMTFAEVAM